MSFTKTRKTETFTKDYETLSVEINVTSEGDTNNASGIFKNIEGLTLGSFSFSGNNKSINSHSEDVSFLELLPIIEDVYNFIFEESE